MRGMSSRTAIFRVPFSCHDIGCIHVARCGRDRQLGGCARSLGGMANQSAGSGIRLLGPRNDFGRSLLAADAAAGALGQSAVGPGLADLPRAFHRPDLLSGCPPLYREIGEAGDADRSDAPDDIGVFRFFRADRQHDVAGEDHHSLVRSFVSPNGMDIDSGKTGGPAVVHESDGNRISPGCMSDGFPAGVLERGIGPGKLAERAGRRQRGAGDGIDRPELFVGVLPVDPRESTSGAGGRPADCLGACD